MTFKLFLDWLLGDKVNLAVYRILSRHREGLTGRGIASLVGTSPFKINQVLRRLVAEGVLESSVAGKSHLYRFNPRHLLIQEVVLPLIQREENFFEELGAKIMQRLNPKPVSIILYGSIARGGEQPASDLDLCLVYPDGSPPPGKITEVGDLLWEWASRAYGNPVSIRRSLISQFQQRARERDPLIQTIIREGIVLHGKSIQEVLDYGSKKNKRGRSSQRGI